MKHFVAMLIAAFAAALSLCDAFAADPYVETSGTQYFLTDWYASPKTKAVVDFQATTVATLQQRYIGADSDLDTFAFSFSVYLNGSGYFGFAAKDGCGNWANTGKAVGTAKRWTFTLDAANARWHLIETGAASATGSGSFTTTRTKTSTSYLAVAADNREGTMLNYASMKFYALRLYDAGILKRCYVPYWKDETVGLCELFSKTVVTNSGTGDVTTGGDQPSDYSSYFAADDGYRWSTANNCVQVCGDATAMTGGSVDVNSAGASAWADFGGTLTFTATPDAGQRFVCWMDDDLTNAQRGENPLAITADRPRNLRARFASSALTTVHYVPGDFASLNDAIVSDAVVAGDTIQLTLPRMAFDHITEPDESKDAIVYVNKGVTIRGADSPADAVIDCSGKGGIVLKHADAVLTGVAISNFCNTVVGPVLRITSGMATNVLVTGGNGSSRLSFNLQNYTQPIVIGSGAEICDSRLEYLNYNNSSWQSGNLLTISGGTMRRTLVKNPTNINPPIVISNSGSRRSLIEDCTIAGGWSWCQAPIQLTKSDMRRCTVSGSASVSQARAIEMSNATLTDTVVYGNWCNANNAISVLRVWGTCAMTNCLVRGNSSYSAPCIQLGDANANLSLVNCTVTKNSAAASSAGAGIGGSAGKCTLINTILWNNKNVDGDDSPFSTYVAGAAVVSNSCYLGAVEDDGCGNVNRDPLFTDAANNDFTITQTSPCVDAGQDVPSLTHDLNGDTRPLSGSGAAVAKWDIGCYEREAYTIALDAELFVTGTRGNSPCDIPLYVTVIGTKRTGLTYEWKATHESGGVTITDTATTSTPEYTFPSMPAGKYSFSCTVANDCGDSVTPTLEDGFSIYPTTVYVSPTGTDTFPYDTPATGVRDLWKAITNAGAHVILTPGTHTGFTHLTESETGLECLGALSVAMEIQGAENPRDVVIDCGGKGGIVLNHADALVHGVTFTNFLNKSGSGHLLYVNKGVVSNVVVAGGVAANQSCSCLNVQQKGLVTDALVTNVSMSAGTAASVAGGTLRRVKFIGNAGKATLSTARTDTGVQPLVEDCEIIGNKPSTTLVTLNHGRMRRTLVTGNAHTGGGMSTIWGGEITRCIITNNSFAGTVVSPYTEGWVGDRNYITDCLFAGNRITSGGVIACSSIVYPNCTIQHCTIADNTIGSGTFGGIAIQGHPQVAGGSTIVKNCLVWGNTVAGAETDILTSPPYTSLTANNSCFAEAASLPDCGNFAADPIFGDCYEPKPTSPCVDTGISISGEVADILGRERPTDGNGDGVIGPDVGCYELPTYTKALEVSIVVDGTVGADPCDIALTASVIGLRKTGLTYHWRAEGVLGEVKTVTEQDTTEPSCVFTGQTTGRYTFSCTVANDQGDEDTTTLADAFRVLPHTVYVSRAGSDTWPYTTPETATHDLWNAVTNAGAEVIVAPGHYTDFAHGTDEGTGRECLAAVSRGVRITGADDPAQVLVDCGGKGGVLLNHADAFLSGVTFTNFLAASGSGAALFINAGTASNIVVKGGTALKVTSPNAVYVGVGALLVDALVTNVANATANANPLINATGGTVRRMTFTGCTGRATAGLYVSGNGDRAVAEDCVFAGNTNSATLLTVRKSDVRRTLVARNRMTSGNAVDVYGAHLRDVEIRNNVTSYTVVGNWTEGWNSDWSYLTNCLVAYNTTPSGAITASSIVCGYIQLDYCTIVDNTATSGQIGGLGGTGWNEEHRFILSVRNSIVWGNTASGAAADILIGGANSTVTADHCCFGEAGSAAGTGNVALAPKLDKNFTPLPTSPCANAAKVLGWEKSGTDLNGQPRFYGKKPDMGANEVQRGVGLCLMVR